jgi:uncharacterized protein
VEKRLFGRGTPGRVRSGERTTKLALVFALFLTCSHVFAAEVIPPKPDRYFNDYASVVPSGAAMRFNEELAQFERETSTQFIVATWKTMPSQSSIEDFTQRTFQAWKVGQQSRNNGVVLFVFVEDHRMRIQPGYGLEGALPDAICDDIIRNGIAPKFRQGDFEGGLATGIDLICKAVRGEYKGTGHIAKEGERKQNSPIPIFVFFIVFIFFAIQVARANRKGGYRYSGFGGPFIGGWSGGSGGGWSSGGGGFSGFSGGGGSSGGGGASGGW